MSVGPALSTRERVVLGLPSAALGVLPLVAPRWTARQLGLDGVPAHPGVLRAVGVRELVVALAFTGQRSPRWFWGFVGQDAFDLPVLTRLLLARRGDRRRLRWTCAGYLVMTTVDVICLVRRVLLARGPARRRAGT